ncbi:MAG: hypothetical protein ACQERX_04505 [Bacillota bacterium]
MKKNHIVLIGFVLISLVYFALVILNLPSAIVVQFNISGDSESVFSKTFVIIVFVLLSFFVGYQLYDEKNSTDYIRWYISALVIVAVEILIYVINVG